MSRKIRTKRPNFTLVPDLDKLFDDEEEAKENKNKTLMEIEQRAREFVKASEAKNTVKKTDADVRRVTDFLSSKKINKNLEELCPEEMNTVLTEYFQELKPKTNESHYEPGTLRGIAYSLERYLKGQGYEEWKILSCSKFALFQDVLKAKMAFAKATGKGNRANRAMPISHEEEDRMWAVGALD